MRHQGDSVAKLQLRDGDHRGLWRSEIELSKDAHALEITRLTATVTQLEEDRARVEDRLHAELAKVRDELRQVVAGLAPETTRAWLETDAVQDAEQKRDRAYRSRDHAMEHLWRLARLHRPDDNAPNLCVCGRRVDGCKECEALDPILSTLEVWEQRQLERAREGREHGLPWDHPELQKLPGRGRL